MLPLTMQIMFQSASRLARRRGRIIQRVVGASLLLMVTVPAQAENDASPWDGNAHSAVRLIAAGPSPSNATTLRAGIEVRLASGWSTYWRYPGDAGVPPRFDFSGSQNAAQVTVLWPAPKELSEGDSRSIGYTDDVILPLRIVPSDVHKPVALRLKVDYAVCGQLCIPATGAAALTVPVSTNTYEAALNRSEARVPSVAAIGAGDGLAITAVRRLSSPRPQVMVDVAAPAAASVALFAEGPDPEWALPVPRELPDPPSGLHRFAFDLEGLPQGTSGEGAVIKLTAVCGDKAIEVDARLD
jgi:DsbC/DsbD-like thiol-disulfide interchange protein